MTDLSQRQATPERLRHLATLGYLDHRALATGLQRIGATPDAQAWARFLHYFLLTLGALFLTSGIFFFIAFNWDELPRFGRFGVIEGAILVTVAIAHWVGLSKLGGKIALTVAALLVGALLAIFGQEYQSGADSYTLFANWALLIAGWVLIARFDLLWVGWLLLLNLALTLFWQQVYPGDEAPVPETLFALNVVGLLLWEWLDGRFAWWTHRWPARLTALGAFGFILWPTLTNILVFFDNYGEYLETVPLIHRIAPLIYLGFLAIVIWVYLGLRPDLFMVTIAFFSIIVVLTTLIGRALIEVDEILTYLVTSIAVIGQAGIAVTMLRRIQRRWEEAT